MDQLLSSNSSDILNDNIAIDIYNIVVKWLSNDDSRMPIAYGIIETIYNRTNNYQLRILCWEARAIYHLHKKDFDKCFEYLLEGFILYPIENIQLMMLKIIPNVKNVNILEKLLIQLNNFKIKNITVKHKDALLFLIVDACVHKIKDDKLYNHALNMIENPSIALFYKGACNLYYCLTEADVKYKYDTHMETIKMLLSDEKHIQNIANFLSDYPDTYLVKVGYDLSYTKYDTKPIQELLGKFYCNIFPYLPYTSPHLQFHKNKNTKRRIGFISANLYGHTISKMFGGVIKYIDRERFEPYLYTIMNSSHLAGYASKYTELPMKDTMKASIELWREIITNDRLDILIYPDIGMIPMTYYLSFSRLAPVQAMWWGHVDSAATSIDYFISSAYFEDKQDQYVEKLIKHPGLSVIYEKPFYSPDPLITRASLGLPNTGIIYMCVQSSYKWTPSFNEIICGILRADPSGIIVAINYYNSEYSKKQIITSIDKVLGYHGTSRIIFVPHQNDINSFLSLCQYATIMLDTVPFSGSTSHLECFSIGKMAITMCGNSLSSSLCTGVYRTLGLDSWTPSPISYSIQEYIAKAIYYAHDHKVREQFEKQLIEKMNEFYMSQKEIDGWNEILDRLIT